jgi:hypothetical protein
MILNPKLRKFAEETTDMLYNIYYKEILNGEISLEKYEEEYYTFVNDTIKYFLRIEDYEKCEKLKPFKSE